MGQIHLQGLCRSQLATIVLKAEEVEILKMRANCVETVFDDLPEQMQVMFRDNEYGGRLVDKVHGKFFVADPTTVGIRFTQEVIDRTTMRTAFDVVTFLDLVQTLDLVICTCASIFIQVDEISYFASVIEMQPASP